LCFKITTMFNISAANASIRNGNDTSLTAAVDSAAATVDGQLLSPVQPITESVENTMVQFPFIIVVTQLSFIFICSFLCLPSLFFLFV